MKINYVKKWKIAENLSAENQFGVLFHIFSLVRTRPCVKVTCENNSKNFAIARPFIRFIFFSGFFSQVRRFVLKSEFSVIFQYEFSLGQPSVNIINYRRSFFTRPPPPVDFFLPYNIIFLTHNSRDGTKFLTISKQRRRRTIFYAVTGFIVL